MQLASTIEYYWLKSFVNCFVVECQSGQNVVQSRRPVASLYLSLKSLNSKTKQFSGGPKDKIKERKGAKIKKKKERDRLGQK